MACKVISVVNMKGGVGKTSTVVGLSETLATDPKDSVLVIDVDTQANASYCLAGETIFRELVSDNRTVDAFFNKRLVDNCVCSIEPYIRKQVSHLSHQNRQLNISLLASSPYLRVTEREIIYELTRRNLSMEAIEGRTIKILSPAIELLRKQYSYIIFDCAPGISAFTTAAISISDFIIIPTIPDFMSTLGLAAFVESILKESRHNNRDSSGVSKTISAHVLITRKNKTKHHKEHHDLIRGKASEPDSVFGIFDTVIPESAIIPEALRSVDGTHPTYTQKYADPIGNIFSELAIEIRGIK